MRMIELNMVTDSEKDVTLFVKPENIEMIEVSNGSTVYVHLIIGGKCFNYEVKNTPRYTTSQLEA